MTMLPDIEQSAYDQYEQERLQRELEQKQQSFSLQAAIGEKLAGLQSLLGGAPPEAPEAPAVPAPPPAPPPPEPAPAPEPVAVPSQPPTPEPTPAPVPQPEPAPPPVPEPAPEPVAQTAPVVSETAPAPAPELPAPTAPVTAPLVAPAPTPAPTQTSISAPSAAPSSGGTLQDWIGSTIGAALRSGADMQAFTSALQPGAGDPIGSAMGAALKAGADMQQFASSLTAPPEPEPPPAAAAPAPGAGVRTGTAASVGGVPGWLSDLIARNAPGDLANDPEFIRTVAAGAKAESGWDPNRIQNGYSLGSGGGARGLFQFDMGGMGKGYREEDLLGQSGAELQASQIVPLYARAYQSAPAGLSGAEKASWVAAQAERPYQYDNPQSSARRNYAAAYGEIGGAGVQAGESTQNLLSRTGEWAQPAKQISQFGDSQLSNDEAYAACGPAAAVRFAQMFGRNPTLREATDLAATVGWTAAGGMAGLGSEKALMDKMGIATRQIGADIQAMAREAQTGNPVTISTPGHYFFADGYDPQSGAFHVGQSGLDLRGGSEWMTADQMQARMGNIQGALLADNPQVPTTSNAELSPLDRLGRFKDTAIRNITGQTDDLSAAVSAVGNRPRPEFSSLDVGASGQISPTTLGTDTYKSAMQPAEPEQSPVDRLKSAFSDFVDSIGSSQAVRNITGTNPDQADIEARYQQAQQAAQNLTGSTVDIPQGPLPLLGGTSPYGVGTAGEQLDEQRNRAIAENNPLRDVPALGGATTFVAQNALDPTNLLLAGEPGVARAAAKGLGAAGETALQGLESRFPAAEAFASTAAPPTGVPELTLPKYIAQGVQDLIQGGHAGIANRTLPLNDALNRVASQAGEDVGRVTRAWRDNPNAIRAIDQAMTDSSGKVAQLQKALRLDPTDSKARDNLVNELSKYQALQEAAGKRLPTAGSLLQDLKPDTLTGQKNLLEQVQGMAKRAKLEPDEWINQLAKADLSDPERLANFADISRNYTFGDRLTALWYFNLLSNPLTHVRNAVSNTLTAVTTPAESLVSAGIDRTGLTRRLLGEEGPRQRYAGESLAQLQGMKDSLGDLSGTGSALRAFTDAMQYGVQDKGGEIGRMTKEPFAGTKAEFMGIPGRALEAGDQFFRAINTGGAIRGEAYRIAKQEGKTGTDLVDRVTELTSKPTPEMLTNAAKQAEYRVFQQTDAAASKINAVIDAWPALKFIVPFTRTPINVTKYMLERSPLGYLGIGRDFATSSGREGLRAAGSGDLSDRLARATVGSAIMGAAVKSAVDGNLTGRLPDDPDERDAFLREGKLPNAWKDPVTGRWWSYQALQPYAPIFGTAADVIDAVNRGRIKDPSDLTSIGAVAALALGRGLGNQTWTQGLQDTLDLLGSGSSRGTDPGQQMERIATQYATNAIPGAALWRGLARMTDNIVRDPGNVPEGVLANLPVEGARHGLEALGVNADFLPQVPERLDAFGFPRERPQSGLDALLNPFASSRERDDPVEKELARLQPAYGSEPSTVDKNITIANGKLPVELTDEQRNRYQHDSGQLAYAMLTALVDTDAWKKLPDERKAKMIDQIYSKAREITKISMTPELLGQGIEGLQKQQARRDVVRIPSLAPDIPEESDAQADGA